jgi:hypothetical protein
LETQRPVPDAGMGGSAAPLHRLGRLQTIEQEKTRMKKLRLDVDALRVDSFATQPGQKVTGTVNAHEFLTEEISCNDTTWGATAVSGCSNDCSRKTCVFCTNEN